MFVTLLGGLGIFLLGITLLTDGLKSLAGAALRQILTRFVAGPLSGVGWGLLGTAIVQSSTATSLTTVGFVSAGLLTFTQAVGIIFGANLGTTSTGWIVSQLGFKVSLGSISPPVVLIGAALRLLSRGRAASIGTALCGFGLMFIGIDMLQGGMGAFSERFSPTDLPRAGERDGLGGRIVLVGIGFLMTLLMQSSSASMAATLAAVASGTVELNQAAAMIVGHNIGNTPTVIAASIGAPAAAKRTALAHALFNVVTATVAFFALPGMLRMIGKTADILDIRDAPTALATFHTAFNVLGVALLLPVVGPFSRFIERMVPERAPRATRFLVPAVAEIGPVAQEVARRALAQILAESARAGARLLEKGIRDHPGEVSLRESSMAIRDVRRFVHGLARASQGEREVDAHTRLLHATDHTARLIVALTEFTEEGAFPDMDDPVVRTAAVPLLEMLGRLTTAYETLAGDGAPRSAAAPSLRSEVEQAARVSRDLAETRRRERKNALADAAAGRLNPDSADARIEALVRLDRVGYHLWRAAHYLVEQSVADAASAEADFEKETYAESGGGAALRR